MKPVFWGFPVKESPPFNLLHDMKNGNIGKNLRVALLVAFLVAVSPGVRPCLSQEVTNSVPADVAEIKTALESLREYFVSYFGTYGGTFDDFIVEVLDLYMLEEGPRVWGFAIADSFGQYGLFRFLQDLARVSGYFDNAKLVSASDLFSEMGVDIDNLLSVSQGIRDQTDNLTFDEHYRLLVQDQNLASIMENIYNYMHAVPDYSDVLADLNSAVSSLGSDVGAMLGTDVGFGGSTGTSELQQFDRDFAAESTSADTWLNSNELDNKGQPPDLALDSSLSVVSMDTPSMSGSFNVTPAEYTPRHGDDVITFLDSNSAKNILEAGRVHVTNLPRVEFSLGSQEQDFQAWVSRIGGWFDELWHWLGVFARFVIAIGIFRPLVRDMLVRRI